MDINSIINKEYDEKYILGSGSYGVVIDNLDGTATKVMRFETISPEPLIKIRALNLDNFYKILDIVTSNNGKNDYLKAYRMEIINGDIIKLHKASIDYLIRNIKILMNSLRILSENYILVEDLYEDNLLVNSDGMFIIDCDLYKYYPSYDKEMIYNQNLEQLKKSIFEHLYKDTNILYRRKLCQLFKDNDLDSFMEKVKNSNSIYEYLKK